jgi:hypothetical protein
MKTPTVLPASTRTAFRWSTALAAAAVLAGCSGAAAKSAPAEPLRAESALHRVSPGAEWPVHHRRHPELGKCLVTPEVTAEGNAGKSASQRPEASLVDGPKADVDGAPMCGASRP